MMYTKPMFKKSIFDKIINWSNERQLIERGFNYKTEVGFILEELLESTGAYDSIEGEKKSKELAQNFNQKENMTNEEIAKVWAEVINCATIAMVRLKYNPIKVMDEVFKEIDSRTGKIIDGKFVKDPDAQKYNADLSNCSLETYKKGFLDNQKYLDKIVDAHKNTKNFDHGKNMTNILNQILYTSDSKENGSELAKRILSEKTGDVKSEDIVDAFADIFVYSTGAIAKLGYNPKKVMREMFIKNSKDISNLTYNIK